MTQAERVLAALRAHPDRGICAVDFLRFPTVDGGPPITRLAARIGELRDAGEPILNHGIRDKCRVYRLAPPLADGQLFATAPRNAIYGEAA